MPDDKQMGLGWLRRLMLRLRKDGEGRTDSRPAHIIDAEQHPENYYSCSVCDDGPWHKTWVSETAWVRHCVGKARLLGACCSGAD